MTEDAHPQHSGSRWEPTGPTPSEGETARLHAAQQRPAADEPVGYGYAGADAGFPSTAAGAAARTPLRRRIPLAVAGLAVAVVGGLGGFAIGHAASGGDDSPAGINAPRDDGRISDGDRHFGDRSGQDGQRPDDGGSLPQGPTGGTGTGGTDGTGTDGT